MDINELRKRLKVPLNTWNIPVLVEGKEIEDVELMKDDDGNYYVEIKLKKGEQNDSLA